MRMRLATWFTVSLLGVLCAGGSQAQGLFGPSLAGAWTVNVNSPEIGSFNIGMVFIGDGNVISTHDPIAIPDVYESAGIGRWERTGPGTYAVTVIWVLSNVKGEQIGSATYSAAISVDDKATSLTGRERAEFRDKKGAVFFAGSATLRGQRIQVVRVEN